MAKGTKKMLNLVQINQVVFYRGLTVIANNLNRISELQGEQLSAWKEAESIIETMTDQPSRDSVYRKEEDYKYEMVPLFGGLVNFRARVPRPFLGSKYRDRNKEPIPLPQLAIRFFNQWAKENPVRLVLRIGETGRIEAGHQSETEAEGALCALWQFYFQGDAWKRLKRCPECRIWFVDETRNAKKTRCTRRCTNKWWSRKWRKETKNKSLLCERCDKKFFPQHKVKGILEKRERCPHCNFLIDPKKRKIEKIQCAQFPSRHLYNNELCLCEQGGVPEPSKICEVKCDYYKKSKFIKKWGKKILSKEVD